MKYATSTFLSVLCLLALASVTAGCTTAQAVGADVRPGLAHVNPILFRDMQFRPVGPTRAGRVTAVEGIPGAPHSFYIGGGPASGVWRTDNYGESWRNISDGKGFKSTSIGAIAVADSDPSIIYVGTGSPDIRDNVLTGSGVYKSIDAGKHWQFVGLKDSGSIGAIVVDPRNPDRVYVAAVGHPFGPNPQRGVFRSTNGGKTWQKVLFGSDTTGAVDLEFAPDNPDIIYAALWRAERKPWTIISGGGKADGLYRSTDGGDHWKKLTDGLPKGLKGRADFAVTAADPARVYALLEASGDKQGLYRSDDHGVHWKLVNHSAGIMERPFYFTSVTADPHNPDVVYAMSVDYWKSVDGGKKFKRVKNIPHGDVHALWINPHDSNIQILGTDGGATVTLDGGKTWSSVNNQPTAELWQVNVDNRFPYRLYAGQQDWSTIVVPSLPLDENPLGPKGWWQIVGGCETGPAVPAPNDPDIVYASCKGRFGQYNARTGQEKQYWVGAQSMYGQNPTDLTYRFQRTSPIEISPHDPNAVYYGAQYVLRTTDGGATWEKISPDLTAFKPQYQVTPGQPINRDVTGEENFSTLNSIRVSPHDKDVIWAGSNDGLVHVTRDGGKHWADVTPAGLPENTRIDAIEPSPEIPGKVYIAARRRYLDDFRPYIYRTTDYGKSWTKLINGIPGDDPTRVVREDPRREGLLYAGTDRGLYISFDDGRHWQQFRQGLPNTAVTDIRIHDDDLVLSTFGRGFWILDDLTLLRQLDRSVSTNGDRLFKPEVAYRVHYRASTSDVPQYPEPGAFIDFYVADATAAPVVLEIDDGQGHAVRRLVGHVQNKEEQKKIGSGDAKEESDEFIVHKGHNRIIWDLRYPGKIAPSSGGDASFGVRRGPLAVPAQYTVHLSVGDWHGTQPLRVRIDPRVKASGTTVDDLQAQLDLALKVRDVVARAKRIAAAADKLQSQLEKKIKGHAGGQKSLQQRVEGLAKLHRQLVTRKGISYPPPKFIDQAEYLYRMTSAADQRPGRDAYERYGQLHKRLGEIESEWQSLRKTGINL